MNATEIGSLATMKDAQQLLKLSRPTIYALIEAGELKSLHFGRALRITMRSVEATLNRRLEIENQNMKKSSF